MAALEEWDGQKYAELAALVVSELVSNAVLHARTALRLTLSLQGDVLRIEVEDGSARLPVQRDYGAESTTGRGLRLLAGLGVSWGTAPGPRRCGKVVWAEITARELHETSTRRSCEPLSAQPAPPSAPGAGGTPAPAAPSYLGRAHGRSCRGDWQSWRAARAA